MKLISEDTLFKHFMDMPWYDNADREIALDAILAIVGVDAVPVRRGKWNKSYKSGYTPTDGKPICSICDCWNGRESNYCPNCGADMRGVE
jgi:hypothetical protein